MVEGEVNDYGIVQIPIEIAGRRWLADVDTGFNGDLELPEELFSDLAPTFAGRTRFDLAAGQEIEQDVYVVRFPIDGRNQAAIATFVNSESILLGTGMLRQYRLIIDFVARTVILERISSGQ